MTRDPPRLSDDPAGPELARALRDAQADVLSPDAVERVRTALQVAGVAAVGAASAGGLGAALPSSSGASAPLSTTAKILGAAVRLRVGLAAVGLAVGLAGAAWKWHAPIHDETPSAPPDHATAPAPPALADHDEAPPRAPPTAVPGIAPPGEVSAPAPEPAAPADAAPATTAGTARARGQGAGGAPSPREGALLLEARRTLGTSPARALALVRAHEQEFPESQLGPERARIAAEARRRLEK